MISIIIPTVREGMVKKCIDAIKCNAGIPDNEYEIITMHDNEGIGCPKMVRRLVEKAHGELICFLGEDCVPQKDFLKHAIGAMKEIKDGWGVVALNMVNGFANDMKASHFLADRRMLDLVEGEFFHTGYVHSYCDNELSEIAFENDRFVWCKKAEIKSPHPFYSEDVEYDPIYKRVYAEEVVKKDRQLYWQRKRKRLNLFGIGLPLAGRMCDNQFWLTFLNMEKPDYQLLVPAQERYEYKSDIATTRNDLIEQALNAGISRFVMMDTDQIYKPDTIRKLLGSGKKVICAAVHRRYPPYDVVAYRGSAGALEYIDEKELYSGDVIEISACGTGCVLYDMAVFDNIEYPWFEDTYIDGKLVGEDINFCRKLKESGENIFLHTGAEVGHLAILNIDKYFHSVFKRMLVLNSHNFDKDIEAVAT